MTLQEYIDGRGAHQVAKILRVQPSTVSHWYNFKTVPRPEQMKKMITDSSGFLTYDGIIEPYLKNKKKRKN